MTTLIAQFQKLPVGTIGTVTMQGERVRIEKTEWAKSGSRALNARKLDGRQGRTFVWSDALVTVEHMPETQGPQPFVLNSYKAVR